MKRSSFTKQTPWTVCDEAYKYRFFDTGRSERILRDGVRRFPGNEIILNNLLVVPDIQERIDEVIGLCRSLIESVKDHSVKYDACRILAENYKKLGKTDLILPVPGFPSL